MAREWFSTSANLNLHSHTMSVQNRIQFTRTCVVQSTDLADGGDAVAVQCCHLLVRHLHRDELVVHQGPRAERATRLLASVECPQVRVAEEGAVGMRAGRAARGGVRADGGPGPGRGCGAAVEDGPARRAGEAAHLALGAAHQRVVVDVGATHAGELGDADEEGAGEAAEGVRLRRRGRAPRHTAAAAPPREVVSHVERVLGGIAQLEAGVDLAPTAALVGGAALLTTRLLDTGGQRERPTEVTWEGGENRAVRGRGGGGSGWQRSPTGWQNRAVSELLLI